MKGSWSGAARGLLQASLLLASSAVANPYSDREEPKAPEVVLAARFDAAVNAGRLDEALSLLADDATVKDLSARAIAGREGLRDWLRESIDRHFHADAGIRQLSDGGRVTWTASLADDSLRALDAAPVAAFIEAIVVGGKIRSWVPRVAAGDRLKIQAAQAKANEAVVRALTEGVIGKGQVELIDRLCASTFVDHDPFPGALSTLAGFRKSVEAWRGACSGLSLTIDDLLTADDRVVVRGTLSGTQIGPLPGISAGGRSFKVESIDIFRVRDGRITEHWGRIDTAAMKQQLVPAPAATAPADTRPAVTSAAKPADTK